MRSLQLTADNSFDSKVLNSVDDWFGKADLKDSLRISILTFILIQSEPILFKKRQQNK